MFILTSMIVSIVVYINTFKDDFTKEKFEKIAPVLMITVIISIILLVLSSIGK